MKKATLRFLTESDQHLLLEKAEPVSYRRGEEIVPEGSTRQALFFLRKGRVRIERGGLGGAQEFASLGPGEVFGEMAFVDDLGASASVVAVDDVEVDVIEGHFMTALLFSVPGLAARFFHSLAVTLSLRLREMSHREE